MPVAFAPSWPPSPRGSEATDCPSQSPGRFTQAVRTIGAGGGGGGERSGGVGPPRPVRRPAGGDSGERVTKLERSPPPTTGPAPPRAPSVREQCVLRQRD